jgi:tagaturonate reductase
VSDPAPTPILQFGTSRFLQAHADLFVSEAMADQAALGPITVVRTTDNPDSAARVAAMAAGAGYPVRIRGLENGAPVDRIVRVRSVTRALATATDWAEIRRIAVWEASVILSNTGDAGYAAHPADGPHCIGADAAPRGFPAKLASLLHARWSDRPDAPLTLLPCELLPGNGARLHDLAAGLARDWALPGGFLDYLSEQVVWGNSLVDRIVSEPIAPVGAVAEPYALWAVERQDRLVLPCCHPAIVLTDALEPFERRKLHLLNLGHTVLAGCWRRAGAPEGQTVIEAMGNQAMRDELEAAWSEEVLPVFDAWGDGDAARAYVDAVRDRFSNPFLAHKLADIAQNHRNKMQLRIRPVVEAAERLRLGLPQMRLRAAMESAKDD